MFRSERFSRPGASTAFNTRSTIIIANLFPKSKDDFLDAGALAVLLGDPAALAFGIVVLNEFCGNVVNYRFSTGKKYECEMRINLIRLGNPYYA
jgi:hypothetical protein